MFDVVRCGDVALITTAEELNAHNASQAKEAFELLVDEGCQKIVLDLSSLSFIDSSGLGAIVTALKSARGAGGEIRLCGLSSQVRSIFDLTRLHRVFKTYESQEEAISSYSQAQEP